MELTMISESENKIVQELLEQARELNYKTDQENFQLLVDNLSKSLNMFELSHISPEHYTQA